MKSRAVRTICAAWLAESGVSPARAGGRRTVLRVVSWERPSIGMGGQSCGVGHRPISRLKHQECWQELSGKL